MDFFEKLENPEGGFIFLSHSHNDIEKVRKIRNGLEASGFEPLCFYLKCLDDDSEIEELIKREIDAREWFVFINSENSRKSKWVTLEREYITQTNKKKIININLDDKNSVPSVIDKIQHNLRVFMSYSPKDNQLAKKLQRKFAEKDYLVYSPEKILAGADWAVDTASAIQEASVSGCVVVLMTENSINSASLKQEVLFAFESGGNVITIFVGDAKPDIALSLMLNHTRWYRLSQDPTDEEIEKMVDAIGDTIAK